LTKQNCLSTQGLGN